MIDKDDPNYIFEQYKGYIIASHKNNVVGRDRDNIIVVYRSDRFPDYGFIIGLDDSKMLGNRRAVPINIDDAKAYIDMSLNEEYKESKKEQHSVHIPRRIKEVVTEILNTMEKNGYQNTIGVSHDLHKNSNKRIVHLEKKAKRKGRNI